MLYIIGIERKRKALGTESSVQPLKETFHRALCESTWEFHMSLEFIDCWEEVLFVLIVVVFVIILAY